MNLHVKIATVLIVIGGIVALGYKFLWPRLEERMLVATSDARDTKGRLVIGVDNWIGYFPLCSDVMKKRMRAAGYVLQCDDDKADYPKRMQRLKSGELHFAVSTVDAYLLNGAAAGFPGAIVAVIDESKGGDAIVGWKDRIATLNALKTPPTPKIAYTPGSPSEHLLRAAAVHFDLATLRDRRGDWRVETSGSSAALDKLLARKVDAAVLWEPDVTRALQTPGIAKLLGTGDTARLIVDVLIAGRGVLQQHPEAVEVLLDQYFQVLRQYRAQPEQLERDVEVGTRLGREPVRAMLSGVEWASLSDNFLTWLGSTGGADALTDTIQATLRILADSGAVTGNPLPDQDPYRILSRQYIGKLYVAGTTGNKQADTPKSSLEKPFLPLSEAGWAALKEVGTLKAFNVAFQSGTSELGHDGKEELDRLMEILRHYPAFRVVVKGHTGLNGDPAENKLLSQERADSVARYLNVTYSMDANRLRVIGYGAEQPLPRLPGEADRAYNYRLPRVEISLLSEAL